MASQDATRPSDQSHEHDPRWTAVDDYTLAHNHPAGRSPANDVLEKVREASQLAGLPDIACPRSLGKFMGLQCHLGHVKHALEVGTHGGYSAIWLTGTNPGMTVTTVEVSEKHAAVARKIFEVAGVSDRVEVIVGPGIEVLPRLLEEIKNGKRDRFGFAFIDADKTNNWNYFDLAVQMGGPGMPIVVDNVVRKGKIASQDPDILQDENVQGARRVIENAGKDSRVEAVVMQTVSEKNYDGFLFAVVK